MSPCLSLPAAFALLSGGFAFGYVLRALMSSHPATEPPAAPPVVGAAAAHPLPDVAPRRLIWTGTHHVPEEVQA